MDRRVRERLAFLSMRVAYRRRKACRGLRWNRDHEITSWHETMRPIKEARAESCPGSILDEQEEVPNLLPPFRREEELEGPGVDEEAEMDLGLRWY